MAELTEAMVKARDKIQIQKFNIKNDDIRLSATMQDYTKEQTEAIQVWINNNLEYIKFNLTYLGRFATEQLSMITIRVLNERLLKITSLVNQNKTPSPQKYLDVPFDAAPLIHLRQNMLSLVAEIVLLKKIVEALSMKFFELKD